MSNKTTLQSHNERLQDLIDTANSLPDAGSDSGGGAVETCTVTVTDNRNSSDASLTVLNNGAIDALINVCNQTVDNVVCGSVIAIRHGYYIPGLNITGGATELSLAYPMAYIKAPTEPDANATIEVYDAD